VKCDQQKKFQPGIIQVRLESEKFQMTFGEECVILFLMNDPAGALTRPLENPKDEFLKEELICRE